jgi:cardiolipin synthase C
MKGMYTFCVRRFERILGFRVVLAVLTAVVSAACGFSPAPERPIEHSSAPVVNPLWLEVGRLYPGNRWHLLNTGEVALEWRLRAIDLATDEINLQTFLWAEDDVGHMVMRRLVAAADRGVKVRILLDDMFTVNERSMIKGLAAHPSVEFRIYNPFRMRPDSFALRELLNLAHFSRANHRMHNKVMTIDSDACIVGGRNLADEYFGLHEHSNFRDMEVLAFGPVAPQMSAAFDAYWNSPWALDAGEVIGKPDAGALQALRRGFDRVPVIFDTETVAEQQNALLAMAERALTGDVAILADAPAQKDPATDSPDQLAQSLVTYIDDAKAEIIIASAYLVPTAELEEAVVRARGRGVVVKVLTNSLRSNNHTAAHSAYRKFIDKLLGHGVALHELRAKAKDRNRYMRVPVDNKVLGLHAKTLLIDDDLSFIGSANLDPRSLQINTEVGLMIRSRTLNQQIRDVLETDFDVRNAWRLEQSDGRVVWIGDDTVLTTQPADSPLQRIEDWFFGLLPLQQQM